MSEAELIRDRGVIGAAMEDPERRSRLTAILSGAEFTLPAHRRLWAVLRDLGSRYEQTTITDLHAALVEAGGDTMALVMEMNACLSETLPGRLGRAEDYARAVREDYARRQAAFALSDTLETLGADKQIDVAAVLASARDSLDGLTASFGTAERAAPVSDLVTSEIVDAVNSARPPMLPTGIAEFDRVFGGLSPTFIVLAGRPGMGKSTFSICVSTNVALSGRRVLIVSMEDSRQVVTSRIIARLASVPFAAMMQRQLKEQHKAKLPQTEEIVRSLSIAIDDTSGRNSETLRSDVLRHVDEMGGVDLVVVDHLGKVRDKGDSLYQRASAASSAMADLQRELGTPLLVVHQMNRGDKTKRLEMPQIDDLRDSGWIEADARQIILLHRKWYYYQTGLVKDPPDEHELTVLVGKNNYGPTGTIRAYCDMPTSFIGDMPDEPY